MVTAVLVAGCGGGGGGDGGYTRDDIANALELHIKHQDEVTYEMAPGKDCVVVRVLTSSDEVESAQSVAGDVPTSLAVNSDGNAGVIFDGFGAFSQDQCVPPAESALNSMSK